MAKETKATSTKPSKETMDFLIDRIGDSIGASATSMVLEALLPEIFGGPDMAELFEDFHARMDKLIELKLKKAHLDEAKGHLRAVQNVLKRFKKNHASTFRLEEADVHISMLLSDFKDHKLEGFDGWMLSNSLQILVSKLIRDHIPGNDENENIRDSAKAGVEYYEKKLSEWRKWSGKQFTDVWIDYTQKRQGQINVVAQYFYMGKARRALNKWVTHNEIEKTAKQLISMLDKDRLVDIRKEEEKLLTKIQNRYAITVGNWRKIAHS